MSSASEMSGAESGDQAAPPILHDEAKPRTGLLPRVEDWFIGALMAITLTLMVVTIVLRAIAPALAPQVTDEVTVYIMVWAILLGCAGVTARGDHIHADFVVARLPRRAQSVLAVLGNIAGLLFALALVYAGFQVARDAFDLGDLSPTNLRFPLWIYYAALPASGVLIAVAHARYALKLARNQANPGGHAKDLSS